MPGDEQIIKDGGHAQRVERAATALVAVLRADPRVQQAFEQWCVAHELDVDLDPQAMRTAIFRDFDRDLGTLKMFVCRDLGVHLSWLPRAMLMDFVTMAVGAINGVGLKLLLQAPEIDWLPKGRAAKTGGDYIERDVEWYYRTRIKRPRDLMTTLAKEHRGERSGAPSHGHARIVVDRTEQLLSLLSSDDGRI